MSESEKQRLVITRAEYDALSDIRGLQEAAHFLVMLAKPTESGRWAIEGSPQAFDALQLDLSDEIYHELSPPSRLRPLRKLYCRLSPDSDL